jgi:hypothetical protein
MHLSTWVPNEPRLAHANIDDIVRRFRTRLTEAENVRQILADLVVRDVDDEEVIDRSLWPLESTLENIIEDSGDILGSRLAQAVKLARGHALHEWDGTEMTVTYLDPEENT